MAQEASLRHPTIGSLRGVKSLPEVEQFLGIQYAKLADRFSRGTLASYPSEIDASSYGPLPVANPAGCDLEHLLLQHTLPHPEYSFSDTECLTLNVSVPSKGVRDGCASQLPVLAFLHGGGYVTGSANWPQWELARIVHRSVEAGTPIVAVGINYRVGPFGFLASTAMRAAGYQANNGLHDQKLALRWIQQHISGFGGDAGKVTLVGSSMGAASAFVHLQSDEPLFHRLAALGGNALMQPAPIEAAERAFALAVKAFGLEELSPVEQASQLVKVPAAELHAKLDEVHAPTLAVVDGDLVKGIPTYQILADPAAAVKMLPGMRWCKTLWMGDCQLDGMITAMWLGDQSAHVVQTLTQHIGLTLPAHDAAAILSAYKVDAANEDNMPAIIDFMQDVGWSQANRACAQAWASGSVPGTAAYLSHVHAPNPWPGAWQGRATHGFDLALALQNYNAFLKAGQKACAERMAKDLLTFVTGGAMPFSEYGNDGASMVYFAGMAEHDRDESHQVTGAEAAQLARRSTLHELGLETPQVLDALLASFPALLMGSKPENKG